MRILSWEAKYTEDGKRNIIRRVNITESERTYVSNMLFKEKNIVDYESVESHMETAQIRIPENDYKLLRPEVKAMLRRVSNYDKHKLETIKMNITKGTEHFALSDYRGEERYGEQGGITISSGNGDGLYDMDEAELRELHDLVEWAIQQLIYEKESKK